MWSRQRRSVREALAPTRDETTCRKHQRRDRGCQTWTDFPVLSSSHVILKGTLVSGMGEGAYYMGLKGYTKQFKPKIGYIPFPGTLNVRLDKKIHQEAIKQFEILEGIKIKSFSDGKRTYGWVKCFPAKLNNSINCELIILERTHHDESIIELISKVCIRKTAKIKDGSKVSVRIPITF